MAPLRGSPGTVIPLAVRREVEARDRECVGRVVGLPGECGGTSELDHIRVGGTSMKSKSVASNLVRTCTVHHRYKTENGRVVRPKFIDYVNKKMAEMAAR